MTVSERPPVGGHQPEEKKGRKWKEVPAGYKLISDIGALCEATIAKYSGKSFGDWYVKFCTESLERYKKYGDRTMFSEKQMSIFHKLEINEFPNGVQKKSEVDTGPRNLGKPGDWDLPDGGIAF